ncbi:MAG: cysteine desulfurase NifS, partial [Deltaproteobacteria bacterium]|nr:cysteine desulfurase NifS [Deltaproteobacteria bacterium]
NNATTRVAPEVVEEMVPYFSELYGNPSSMHNFGGQVEKKVIEARGKVASLFNCDSSEILFTSCGTESDSTAIQGTVESYPYKKHIITTRVEHPAVLNLCRHLSKNGYKLTELAVDKKGCLDLSELENAIVDNTAIVSIMCANNETGVIFPIEEIGEIVKSKGAVFHCDAVQATGKIPLDMSKCAIDLLSLSGHKLHAPKGIGALYIRKGAKLTPFIIGGHQERGRRAGTENVPYIIGLGKASELALKHIEDGNTRIKALRDRLEKELLRKCTNTRTNGDTEHRLPNTTNISFEFVEGEAILLMLSQKGIAASSGSACTSGSLEPSHVLRAMGIPFTFVHGSLRLSLSRYNNEEDIDYIIEHLPPIIERLREISPFGKD